MKVQLGATNHLTHLNVRYNLHVPPFILPIDSLPTLQFICEIGLGAANSSVHSLGTTYLAVAGATIYPLRDVWLEYHHHGWAGVKQHWSESLKYGLIIAVGWPQGSPQSGQ